MNYVIDVLKEHQQNLKDRNLKTSELMQYHQKQLTKLENEMVDTEIKLYEIYTKINYLKNNPSIE